MTYQPTLVFDKSVTVSCGLWICADCKAESYGGRRTLHNQGCPHLPNTMDYSGLEFHFGPIQIERARDAAATLKNEDHKWYGISVSILKEQFSEQWATFGADK